MPEPPDSESLQQLRELARANRGAAGIDDDGGRARRPAAVDSGLEAPADAPGDRPDPDFTVTGARAIESASVPTLRFEAEAEDRSGHRIHFIALSVLLTVEPGLRSYDDRSRSRLVELFGEPERWASTTGAFRWSQVDVVVPAFTGRGRFHFDVPCSYDHEIAATKYFAGVSDGVYPLQVHFNGTTYYEGEDGRLQMLPLAWDRSTRFELPVATWKRMIAAHYPHGGWIRLSEETLGRLGQFKAASGTPTLDDSVARLLDEATGRGDC